MSFGEQRKLNTPEVNTHLGKNAETQNLKEKEDFKKEVETAFNKMKEYASQNPDLSAQISEDLNKDPDRKQAFLLLGLTVQRIQEYMKKNDAEFYEQSGKKIIDEYILIINKIVQCSEKIEYFEMFFKIFESPKDEIENKGEKAKKRTGPFSFRRVGQSGPSTFKPIT